MLGANGDGRLGDGTTTNRLTPYPVIGLPDVAAVDVGGSHSCALRHNGTTWCWGANGDGQLGDSTTTSRLTATQVSGLTGVIAISAGSEHTCAVKQNRGLLGGERQWSAW